ncbi:MAG: DUF2589 domain-containing protein [Microcoleus sp.]|uniref:DUF2589 domain-containing protein n=1 Tax=Microcoleus sp. TaxID=44472 RepID=UPI003C70E907
MAIQDDAVKQLGALPFGNIIGGPLVAAIEAQAKAARSTVEFIESVSFAPLPEGSEANAAREIQNIEFKYESKNPEGESQQVVLTVPLLAIVPIPYIRIDDMTIQFKANISAETASQDTTTKSTTTDINANVTGKYGWGPAKVEASFSAAYSAKKDSSSAANSKYSVEYTMDVYVHAVQDDMPAGMQKVLNILNESINIPPATPVQE